MKILLIGKNGQLGRELEKTIRATRHTLFAFGHKELDICDYEVTKEILKKIRPNIVINASAFNLLTECDKNPLKAFTVNAFAVKNLAEACREQNAKFITYSTDYVFDGTKGESYIENDRPNPLQMYGLSKLAGELTCLNYNPNSIVIRTCGVYGGKLGSRVKGNFVLTIVREAKTKKTLEISSEQIVSPTYAYDLALGTIQLLEHSSARGVYHLVNNGQCSWYEFAKEIVKITHDSMRIIPVDRRGEYNGVKRPLFSALANTRAKILGISMPSWQDGLKRYL